MESRPRSFYSIMPIWDRTLALAVAFCNANPTISLTTNKECYSKRYQFGNNPLGLRLGLGLGFRVSLRADNLFNKMMFGLSQGLCYFLLSRFHLHALRTYSSASLFFTGSCYRYGVARTLAVGRELSYRR